MSNNRNTTDFEVAETVFEIAEKERAEKERIANHEANIKKIEQLAFFDGLPTSTEVTDRINFLEILDISGYQEFTTRVNFVRKKSIAKLRLNPVLMAEKRCETEIEAKRRGAEIAAKRRETEIEAEKALAE